MQDKVNPHAIAPLSPLHMLREFWRARHLLLQLTRREIQNRYKGSVLGMLWNLINPILMLGVYTFVFVGVLRMRWPGTAESTSMFAGLLFAGMCVFNLFSDVVNRAPRLIIDHANLVKRVVFPVEILPLVSLAASLYQFFVNFGVLLLCQWVIQGTLPVTALALPLLVLPTLLTALGLSWLLGALGVYLRDIAPVVSMATMALMFLSPVFYDAAVVPVALQPWYALNPVAQSISAVRQVLIWGEPADWSAWGLYLVASASVAWLGYCCFQLTRKGFADVL